MPLPLALLVFAVSPAWWPVLPVAAIVRAVAAYIVSARVLDARINWLLLPIEDLLEFCFWIAGFFGHTISWRGRRYKLFSDGRFELLSSSKQ
jgi:ceramide glucosyltransferase